MENVDVAECAPAITDTQSVNCTEAAENFQKFIYQLFEKNGILNDLRAYLRGHIVNVLKSAQTGDPPACQKHFTQRLDLTYQALNILITEYLMRLEFSYSFSVFVSEIPLANMVFDFAKTLMQSCSENHSDTRFNNSDIWSILNYLGIQCDGEHATNIVEMYKSDNVPLMLCILKCMPMFRRETTSNQQLNSSDESVSSAKSSDTLEEKNSKTARNLSFHDKCKHYAFCKTCQNRISKIKDKYKKKKKYLTKSLKVSKVNPFNVETMMKNISVMERTLIDEMFEQLKTVYEAEVEMLRAEEEKRVKHSLAAHAMQLQKRREEMEESFRAREAELERNIQQKKRFLWGLARSLREQHARLASAMQDLQAESSRLSEKEESFKAQLAEAEEILRKRGEDMRTQITNELTILEGHLESMKKERDNINRERIELEHLKSDTSKASNVGSHDLHPHYDLLKTELGILRKYLETSKLSPKCVIERSTVTDLSDVTCKLGIVLNNGQDLEKNGKYEDPDDRLKNQLVNDLKKKKNVNFSQSNLDEIFRDLSRVRSRSSSSEAGDAATAEVGRCDHCDQHVVSRDRDRDVVHRLSEENDRLKDFARQQREHIDELSSAQARLQAELTSARFRAVTEIASPVFRPRTAPTLMPQPNYFAHSMNTSASANLLNFSSWRKGAGEELSMFSNAQPRIVLPGEALPFIGVPRAGHDSRRHLINQWRALRRRVSPSGGVSKPRTCSQRDRNIHAVIKPGSTSGNICLPQTSHDHEAHSSQTQNNIFHSVREKLHQHPKSSVILDINKNREKSPKSVLREAKEKLRNKENITENVPAVPREKSPNAVLREAKLRLRKLEIEAEAVEKSYLDFRKKQSELRGTVNLTVNETVVSSDILRNLDVRRNRSLQKLDDVNRIEMESQYKEDEKCLTNDFDKYLREYQTKFDIGGTHFRNRTFVADNIKPIPKVYSNTIREKHTDDYIETPLAEFRKLYQSERQFKTHKSSEKVSENDNKSDRSVHSNMTIQSTSRKDAIRKAKHNKDAELEILKQNISKIYNLPNQNIDNVIEEKVAETPKLEDNLLRVQIESVHEVNDESHDHKVLVVVESCAETRDTIPTKDINNTEMTIIVRPNRSPRNEDVPLDRPKRSVSPEKAANLTRNDVLDAIFNADANNHISSIQMDLELSSKEVLEDSISEYEKGDDYPDDFSADVDNYNSRSDYDNTPISLPKTSEDENFWDS